MAACSTHCRPVPLIPRTIPAVGLKLPLQPRTVPAPGLQVLQHYRPAAIPGLHLRLQSRTASIMVAKKMENDKAWSRHKFNIFRVSNFSFYLSFVSYFNNAHLNNLLQHKNRTKQKRQNRDIMKQKIMSQMFRE